MAPAVASTDDQEPGEDTVTVTIRNDRTGRWTRYTLGPADWAVLYGPELELGDSYRVPLVGVVRISLRPKRRRH